MIAVTAAHAARYDGCHGVPQSTIPHPASRTRRARLRGHAMVTWRLQHAMYTRTAFGRNLISLYHVSLKQQGECDGSNRQ
jgi:hypothetical protein